MSHILLALIYYAVLTPIPLMVRWRRGEPLLRQFDPATSTYWTHGRRDDGTGRQFRQY